jgi:hypothetical protein
MSLTIASVDIGGNAVETDYQGGALSSTGRYFTFGTFLRDTCLGVSTGCSPSTIQFTTGTPPLQAGTGVSTDARYVTSLECPDVNLCVGQAVLIDFYDTCNGAPAGCTPGRTQPFTTPSPYLERSYTTPNGRYVCYSAKTHLDALSAPIYIFDTCAGAPPGCATTLIQVATDGRLGGVVGPALSDDGRYFAYTDPSPQVLLHDTCLDAPPGCSPSDSPISNGWSSVASISGDAQYVAYNSGSLLLQATCLNASPSCSSTPVTVASTSALGAIVSAAGRFVAYGAYVTINGTQLANPMVLVFDSCIGAPSGCVQQSLPICLSASGAVPNATCNLVGMSSDGQFILFSSAATNLGPVVAQGSDPPLGVSYIVKNPFF